MKGDTQDKNELDAKQLEEKYVHQVYEEISDHFNKTRYKPWPIIRNFLQSLPTGSLVLDLGCGNGKYLSLVKNIQTVGCDRSTKLVEICRSKNLEVVVADMLQIPFRYGVADACICIAVLHHFACESRRLEALKLNVNLLRSGGKLLIYVWAFEQEKDGKLSGYVIGERETKKQLSPTVDVDCKTSLLVHQNRTKFEDQDVLVPWKDRTKTEGSTQYLRYYHVFKEGELEDLLKKLDVKICETFYDHGNWCAIIEKC